jgi:ClpP class serine protease
MEKLGIADATIKSGALKDIGSGSRPQTKEDKEVLQAFVALNRSISNPKLLHQTRIIHTGHNHSNRTSHSIFSMSSMNYSGLMEKLGIADATIKSGALKDIGSGSRPQTKDRKFFHPLISEHLLHSFYDHLLQL